MYEIDVCYKIIFEAMLEENELEKIADRISKYTAAEVIFVSGSGKILAYSHACENGKRECIQQKHITQKEYEHYRKYGYDGEGQLMVEEVELSGRFKGYIAVIYKEKNEQIFYRELVQVIGQAVKEYLEEEQKGYLYAQPFGKSVTAWSLLHEETLPENMEERPEPRYIGLLLQKQEIQERELLCIESLAEIYCVYEDQNELFLLFSGVSGKNLAEIYDRIREQKIPCSVSEPFGELTWCAAKYRLLKRMSLAGGTMIDPTMKREKEWSVQGLYTYTLPLLESAGLSDYRILRLIQEDEENNTDLYHTLKMYLLNGNNVTAAAENLHIHRNTLVYRLKQIKECMEIDINDNGTARELLSFMMMYDIARRHK